MPRSRLQGPLFDPAHAELLRERVFPDGSGYAVTDAGRYYRSSPPSHVLRALADAELINELQGSLAE